LLAQEFRGSESCPKRFGYHEAGGCAVWPLALSGAAEIDLVALETRAMDNEINKLITQ
jgi:hypothetical protein